ncbi:hypothetical protein VB620_09965 [Nodularia harveyana UHCC-0300]|uniref:Secreted protein n=1 Tax=Nodularia harveyana UHCC-0300 TaxID=2974287 RepID=A0ABU5UES5_9CYAN|nr:hypothetical protein [Nodularia harveyana]MEA5581664.1 hypothetical protein [Nodularia harveyana UHCC-0300]
MKKQPFFLAFALAFTVVTYFVGASDRAYAGKEIVPGTAPDSGSAIGDKEIVPGTGADSGSSTGDKLNISGTGDDSGSATGDTFTPAPGVDLEIVKDGDSLIPVIRVPIKVQNNLNRVADDILNRPVDDHSPLRTIRHILPGGVNASQPANHLQSAIVNLGVSTSKATALVSNLNGLTGETQNVNIHKFNDAVTVYNQILNESTPQVLQSLGHNPEFLTINNVLMQLRDALIQH